jgi:hypothetical protein
VRNFFLLNNTHFFLLNNSSIGLHFLPFWSAILSRKRSPFWLWWKESKQYAQGGGFVESTVWHTTLTLTLNMMLHRKFMMGYIIEWVLKFFR